MDKQVQMTGGLVDGLMGCSRGDLGWKGGKDRMLK